jgi:tricarballylate dehydrogenase
MACTSSLPFPARLHTARTNAFFMGGGMALVNAYLPQRRQARGADPLQRTGRSDWNSKNGRFVAAHLPASGRPTGSTNAERIDRPCLRAGRGRLSSRTSPGFGRPGAVNERGEWPADNFLIRGTKLQPGRSAAGTCWMITARTAIGDPHAGAHGRHRRARAALRRRHLHPHRLRVARRGGQPAKLRRFHDEGEDFWPKRYAIWGRLVALQPGQTGYSIIDAKAIGRFMPPVFPGVKAHSRWPNWRSKLGLDVSHLHADPGATTTPRAALAPSTTRRWTTATPKA